MVSLETKSFNFQKKKNPLILINMIGTLNKESLSDSLFSGFIRRHGGYVVITKRRPYCAPSFTNEHELSCLAKIPFCFGVFLLIACDKKSNKELRLFIDDKVFHLPTFILKSLKECTLISASFFFIAIAKSAIVTM